jgi:membrane protein implicated in regulation of membrane protease activity
LTGAGKRHRIRAPTYTDGVALLVLMLLIILAATGGLFLALKIAVGVALGLFLGIALIGALVYWRVKRALFGPNPRWRRVPGSKVEVLDRGPRRYGR